ncbi:hypothetical protein AK812_SmicGene11178 [Symbiodinium microadriaticum]|uniref:Uncharacterized protein n=1 Tax=Symbiodinium microadriaticum TaxID=2951 RepID=A0A1Q9EDV1_SYMMI|nr:hypothetical protein AK812_SmicGene11178 [Symbiodinium microadriaticum]
MSCSADDVESRVLRLGHERNVRQTDAAQQGQDDIRARLSKQPDMKEARFGFAAAAMNGAVCSQITVVRVVDPLRRVPAISNGVNPAAVIFLGSSFKQNGREHIGGIAVLQVATLGRAVLQAREQTMRKKDLQYNCAGCFPISGNDTDVTGGDPDRTRWLRYDDDDSYGVRGALMMVMIIMVTTMVVMVVVVMMMMMMMLRLMLMTMMMVVVVVAAVVVVVVVAVAAVTVKMLK